MALNLRKDDENPILEPGKKQSKSDKLNLNNKVVCITGTIPGLTRYAAESNLRKKFPNIQFSSGVNSITDYLITGHGVGQTKLKAAEKHNVQIIESSTLFN